jgi:hypothetical protein
VFHGSAGDALDLFEFPAGNVGRADAHDAGGVDLFEAVGIKTGGGNDLNDGQHLIAKDTDGEFTPGDVLFHQCRRMDFFPDVFDLAYKRFAVVHD